MLIIRPVLCDLCLWSVAAENLLLGTAVQESGLRHLCQLHDHPSREFFQIKPETDAEIHENFLVLHPGLAAKIHALLAPKPSHAEQLTTNLAYATAIARIVYYRCPEQLPDAQNIAALAHYWKRHFNKDEGRGSIPAFILNFKEFIT